MKNMFSILFFRRTPLSWPTVVPCDSCDSCGSPGWPGTCVKRMGKTYGKRMEKPWKLWKNHEKTRWKVLKNVEQILWSFSSCDIVTPAKQAQHSQLFMRLFFLNQQQILKWYTATSLWGQQDYCGQRQSSWLWWREWFLECVHHIQHPQDPQPQQQQEQQNNWEQRIQPALYRSKK